MPTDDLIVLGIGLALVVIISLATRSKAAATIGPWFSTRSFKRLPEEIVALRVVFAWILFKALPPPFWEFPSQQPHPNGIAHFMDLTFLADPHVWPQIHGACGILLIFYALGIGLPLVLPLILAEQICVFTLTSSQGAIGHSMQLVVLIVLAQTVAYTLWPAWKWLARRIPWSRPPTGGTPTLTPAEMALTLSSQTIVAAYVICGLSKVVFSGGSWFADIPNLAVQLQKTEMMDYYNTLTVQSQPLQDYMLKLLIEHPWQARVAFGAGLLLELGAIMALFGRRWELLLGVATIVMHKVISESMSLYFPFHMWVLFLFWVNVPFWIGWGIRKLANGKVPLDVPLQADHEVSIADSPGIAAGK